MIYIYRRALERKLKLGWLAEILKPIKSDRNQNDPNNSNEKSWQMTENNIHRLGNVTFRLRYNISLIGNDSLARIAVFPAVFPTLFSASCPKFLHSFHSCRNFGHSAENKVGNTAGKTAILAIESFPINEISYQTLSYIT